MSDENKLQRLESNWLKVDLETRSRYILHNLNKADCSFLVKANDKNSQKILNGFKWILSDISPYFNNMFKANSKCKQIPIDDPYFEDFLIYVHTQCLKDAPFELLLDMHERSKIYEIPDLNKFIMEKLLSMINGTGLVRTKWIYFFEIYAKKMKIPELGADIKKALVQVHGEQLKKVIEMSMDTIVKFDVDLFISLITIMSGNYVYQSNIMLILQTIETYVEKNPSFEVNIKSGNMTKSALISILQINQYSKWIDLEYYKAYPKITELLK